MLEWRVFQQPTNVIGAEGTKLVGKICIGNFMIPKLTGNSPDQGAMRRKFFMQDGVLNAAVESEFGMPAYRSPPIRQLETVRTVSQLKMNGPVTTFANSAGAPYELVINGAELNG
jgi:hypothetical protein